MAFLVGGFMITGLIALLIIGLFRFSIHYSALVDFMFLEICPFHLGYTVFHVQFILLPHVFYFHYVTFFISDFSLFESFVFFLVLAKGLSFKELTLGFIDFSLLFFFFLVLSLA